MVRKAIVLAAGMGTRLRPLTCVVPKPLLPVWGEAMLTRVVAMLKDWGVEEIRVNAHYLAEQVEEWAKKTAAEMGLEIEVSVEKEILGTGGVLNPLRDWIGGDDFYLVNGDIVVEGFEGFGSAAELTRKGADGVEAIGLCLMSEEGPRTIEADPSGYITCWKSLDAGFPGTYTYCGIALLKAEILKYVKAEGFSTIVEAYEAAMMDGKFMRGKVAEGALWTDAGTIANYVEVNTAGDENALADLPQLAAVGAKSVEFLGARGSDRCFFKVDGKIVIIYDDAKRAENAKYVGHAKWLKAQGIPVPEIEADLPEMKTMVMSWAGREKKMMLEDYVKVVEVLAKFNGLDASGLELEKEFDAELWAWERELFKEYCLGARYSRACPKEVEEELKNVAAILEKEPKALVHRDFQSSNILWKNGEMTMIDFQGMRKGPAVYDLASLLYDPYAAKLMEGEKRALVKLYGKASGREGIGAVVAYAAVERLVQCLGAYGRLASVGQAQFGKYVLPALENLLEAADEAGLDAVGALAEDLIAAETHAHEHHHEHHEGCDCHHHHE